MNSIITRTKNAFWMRFVQVICLANLTLVWTLCPVWTNWQAIRHLDYYWELVFQLTASLYVCALFLLKGTSGASEVRSRLATFYVAVVIFVVVGFTGLDLRVWLDTEHDLLLAATNCAFRQKIVWVFLPLLACYAVHSAAHCVRELHRLNACWRNTVARVMVAIILCTGFVAMVIVFRLAQADMENEMAEIVEVSQYYRIGTDQTTARLAAECPDDYRIQLLRVNWLLESERTAEAARFIQQIRANTNLPAHVSAWLNAELARRQETNVATPRRTGDLGVR